MKRSELMVNWFYKWIWQIIAFGLIVCSFFPEFVKWAYTNHVFRWLSMVLRMATGLIPIALGEFIYIFLLILLIYKVLKRLFKYNYQFKISFFTLPSLYKISKNGSILLIIFELLWGLNYHQSSPTKDFKLQLPQTYSEKQMDSMSLALILQLNQTRATISDSQIKYIKPDSLFRKAIGHYNSISIDYPFLSYPYPNLKWAQLPKLGDYIGYLAFYHPITGEAIVREDLPLFTLPFTISHEIAHQLGYASETEANFIAYVLASNSKDPLFLYAMQLQLFSYSQEAQLIMIAKTGDFKKWEAIVKRNKALLSPQVIADRKKIRAFFLARQNKRLPGTEKMYDQFLIWNKQAHGINSYIDVLLWALAYQNSIN